MRRVHVPRLFIGEVELDENQAHHVRDVLRLTAGTTVEVFDDIGATARGTLAFYEDQRAAVHVERVEAPSVVTMRWTVASAVPKGNRADWLIEKLSELGTSRFIPLSADRSVVVPEGRNKLQRWARLAEESAKQSRRPGVMSIDDVTDVTDAIEQLGDGDGWYLSTTAGAAPIARLIAQPLPTSLTLFIGPEGGWTDGEIHRFEQAGLTGVALTATILRVETAAVAAAAIVGAAVAGASSPSSSAPAREPGAS